MNGKDPKYQIDTKQNREFLCQIAGELLSFGQKFPSPEGSAYYLGDDGTPWTDRSRDTYETCRMAHVYTLGKYLEFPGSDDLIDAALKGIRGELRDSEYGGWYSGVTAGHASSEHEDSASSAGPVPVPGKQCYAHAFVLLAASSALIAKRPGAKDLLDEAIEIYDRCFWDEESGLACDTWNTEFTVRDSYRGLNANMHSVEAFLGVADAAGDERFRERAGRIIDHVIGWAGSNSWRIPEHYREDWTPDLECSKDRPADQFKPYGATPGHGLEWARLILQWAFSSLPEDEQRRAPYLEAAKMLFERAVKDGWNCDGGRGIVYTTDWEGRPVVHDRMHWVLAEAINTAAVLYRVTGEEEYAGRYAEFMCYLDECVLDHEHGSWFHQLDRNGRVLGTVWPGKPDTYHALQAVLIPYCKVGPSIAAALRDKDFL